MINYFTPFTEVVNKVKRAIYSALRHSIVFFLFKINISS